MTVFNVLLPKLVTGRVEVGVKLVAPFLKEHGDAHRVTSQLGTVLP